MKKILALIAALTICAAGFTGCGSDDSSESTTTTTAASTTAAESTTTEAPATTTEAPVTTTEAPKETVPDNSPSTLPTGVDLMSSLTLDTWQINVYWREGAWLFGSDKTPMAKPITFADLKDNKYLNISYTCDLVPEEEQLALMFKIKVDEETNEEYLCKPWSEYGPKGHTHLSDELYTQPLKSSGVFQIETAKLAALMKDGQTIFQMGMCSFGTATYTENDAKCNVKITGASLSK